MSQSGYGTPEYRLYRTANRYGMTSQQLLDKLEAQGYECIICGCELFPDTLRVDHKYDCCTGSSKKNTCGKCNRGLTCHSCNLLIGAVEKIMKEGTLQVIINYISEWKQK